MAESKVALLFVLVVCLVLVASANSQLTFTPTWGKRDPGSSLSGGSSGGSNPQMMYTGGSAETNCKTSMESLLMIYRLIQTEAQRIMACNGK